MAKVEARNLTKIYEDGFKAVDGIDLDIQDKEFVVLVGPSGCGKSTTLRMIAGLETISDGELYIGDDLVNHVEPKDRDIAMVFQSYALYPHMTVRDNMAFGLKMSGMKKQERYERVERVAKILQLDNELKKKPGALSGGQRQRVALGRAMVRSPQVFLLDEPLSNLDAKLRVAMRGEIVALHRELDATFIYVTHDQTEAMTMGNRIAVMSNGVVEQFDTPDNLYNHPVNLFVAQFIGSPQMNLIQGELINQQGQAMVSLKGHQLPLASNEYGQVVAPQSPQEIWVGIRPENIHYEEEPIPGETIQVLPYNVEQVGSDTYAYFSMPDSDTKMVARFNPPQRIQIGETINIRMDRHKLHIFDRSNQVNLRQAVRE